jgi:mRNA interferase RelE/StbE
MSWKLKYSDKARKQLRKLDATKRAIILSWMDKNIDGCDDPRVHGKGLVENHTGEWRYRIGDFRVLCDIQDDQLVVLAFKVDHRNKVYKR